MANTSNKELLELKHQLEVFFETAQSQTIKTLFDKESFLLNKSLFEFEKYIYDLKLKYKVNQFLDIRILSQSILNSFERNSTYFRTDDYVLTFLIYLCSIKNHSAEERHEIIRDFIELVKEKLTYLDIKIHKTGATRCYANVEFALDDLRKLCLVYNKVEKKRSVMPTPVGYLISLHKINHKIDLLSEMPNEGSVSRGAKIPLNSAIIYLKESPDDFLRQLFDRYNNLLKISGTIKRILNDYETYILKYITIEEDKLVIDEKGLKTSAEQYYTILSKQVDLAIELKKLFLEEIKIPYSL